MVKGLVKMQQALHKDVLQREATGCERSGETAGKEVLPVLHSSAYVLVKTR